MKKKILALILSGCIILQNSALPVLASEPVDIINEDTGVSEVADVESEDTILSDTSDIEDDDTIAPENPDAESGEPDVEETQPQEGEDSESSEETDLDSSEMVESEDDSEIDVEIDSEVDASLERDEAADANMTEASESSSDSTECEFTEGLLEAVSIGIDLNENDEQNIQNMQYEYVESQTEADDEQVVTAQNIGVTESGRYFGYVIDDLKKHIGTLQRYISTAGTVTVSYKLGTTHMVTIGDGVFAGMDDKDTSARNLLPVESTSGKTHLSNGETKILELLNEQRIKRGIAPLMMNTTLRVAAQRKTLDMYNKNYYDHYDFDGRSTYDWLQTCGYPDGAWGENIALSYKSAENIFYQWFTSADHYYNMMNSNYNSVGIGVYKNKDGMIIGTMILSGVKFQNITNVTVEFGYESIGAGAFENCTNLRKITIPSSVLEIADNAFSGCSPLLVIRGKKGSYAESYAKDHEIDFKAINEKSPITKFGFDENEITLEVDDWDYIGFNMSPSEYDYILKFEMEPATSKVLDIQEDGTIHALSKGTVTIKASIADMEDSCQVTVADPAIINIDSIRFYDDELVLYVGDSIKPAYSVEPVNNTDTIKLASSNSSVIKVDNSTSTITALRAGSAVLTVTGVNEKNIESAKASINVRVLTVDNSLRVPTGLKAVTNITPTLNDIVLPTGYTWKEPRTKLKADDDEPIQYFAAQYKNDKTNILQDCFIPISVSTVSGITVDMPGKSTSLSQKLSLLETYEIVPSIKFTGAEVGSSYVEVDYSISKHGIVDVKKVNNLGNTPLLVTPQSVGKCNVTVEVNLKDEVGSYGPLNKPYGKYTKKYTFQVEDAAHASDFLISLEQLEEDDEQVSLLSNGTVQATENVNKFRIRVTALDVDGESQNTAIKFKADKSGIVSVKAVKGQNNLAQITVKKTGTAYVTVTAQDSGKRTADIAIDVKQIAPQLNAKTVTLNKLKPTVAALLDIKTAADNPIRETVLYEDKKGNNVSNLFDVKSQVQMGTTSVFYYVSFKDGNTANVKKASYKLYLKTVTNAGEFTYPITVKLKNKYPSPKYKQTSTINLFYKDASAELKIDKGTENLTDIQQINVAKGGPHFETSFYKAQDGNWSAEIYPVGVNKDNYKKIVKYIELRFFYNEYGKDYSIYKKINVNSCYNPIVLTLASKSPVIYSKTAADQSVIKIKEKVSGNILTVGGTDDVEVWIDDSISDRVRLTSNKGEEDIYIKLLDENKKSMNADVFVAHANWWEAVPCPVKITVNNQSPQLALEETNFILNSSVVGTEVWDIRASVSGNDDMEIMRLRQSDIVGTTAAARKLLNENKIGIYPQKIISERSLRISLNYSHVKNGTYKYKVYAWCMDEENQMIRMKPVTLTIKVTDKRPSATIKAKGKIDISNPGESGIIYTPQLTNMKGDISTAILNGEYASQFIITDCGDGTYDVKLRAGSLLGKGSYKIYFTFVLENGIKVDSKTVTIKL